MPMTPRRTAGLALLASLSLVSACASRGAVSPPPADLAVEAKPLLDPAALGSDQALNDHDAAVEAWGERGWLAVGRLCRWARDNRLAAPTCPKAEE